MDRLVVEVNNLRRAIGAIIEEAEDWVACLLEEKGYQLLEEAWQIRMDGEIDVAMPVARDRQVVWAVVEAQTRLSQREMEDGANRMRSGGFRRRLARHGVPGPYLVYVYGLRVDAACDPAARQFGIGLITGRGEQAPPSPLFPPQIPTKEKRTESCGERILQSHYGRPGCTFKRPAGRPAGESPADWSAG